MSDDDRVADLPDPTDPAVAAALERTRADLAAHGARTPAMPSELLADIDRALARERDAGPSDTGPSDTGPSDTGPSDTGESQVPAGGARRRRPSARWLVAAAAAVVVAVAAVVAVSATAGSGIGPAPAPPTAAPGPAPTAPGGTDVPVLAGGDGPAALRAGLGRSDYGPLADTDRLAGCLAAHGVPAGVRPVGAREVAVDGRPGVLLVLPTGVAARFRLLVVEPGCAAGTPLTVSDTTVGR
ncbi:hypothetical protein Acsp06_53130 [Actinomycetospora sp. NBRC 106375]|uniref:hypothetical protein n=1 Tax=Actinomycetospora sp. NBRC 106375 TaxID=3032207 RepID=UPI0024A32379|nr:hypothetical protein [Actinomycetospora sp. NBRC 106375]GLZ49128.1 hypothetical protein Acsp06_53130 [Actinomycetospora sp. NBRC 106375]